MRTLSVRIRIPEAELLDAGEELERLLLAENAVDPPLRGLLLALDDAITDAFLAPAPVSPRERRA